MRINDIKWKRANHGLINMPLLDYLENILEEEYNKGHVLKICVGTDSQKKNKRGKGYKFATAIIIEMKEPMGMAYGKPIYKGLGAKVISGFIIDKKPMELQERMIKETQMSINVMMHIVDLIDLYEVEAEIHADVNPNPRYESNKALAGAVGFISGMGFKYKVKPEAYAASSGADKICNS